MNIIKIKENIQMIYFNNKINKNKTMRLIQQKALFSLKKIDKFI